MDTGCPKQGQFVQVGFKRCGLTSCCNARKLEDLMATNSDKCFFFCEIK